MRSPRLTDIAVHASVVQATASVPTSLEEIEALVALARTRGALTVTVGHARDTQACAAASAFAHAWSAIGRDVLRVVDWPESAASWLRPARRFATPEPDLWVVAGMPTGWAQMARRLTWSTEWKARKTLAFAGLAFPETLELAGVGVLDGLSGCMEGGLIWRVRDDAFAIEGMR